MNKFFWFNGILALILIGLFFVGSHMHNYIDYGFGGDSWLNPVTEAYYYFGGMIIQVFSAVGLLIQLIFINRELSSKVK